MNLLVSDYDQTVSTDDLSIRFNIKQINEFRKNGNLFMLSTGREYSSIKGEVKKWNIKYDYLSCADGTTMYDRDDKLIFISKMDRDDVKVSEFLKKQYGQKINIYDIISDNSNIPEEKVIQIFDINFIQISRDITKFLDENLINSTYSTNLNCIYLKHKEASKSLTIQYLENEIGIEKRNIFTIGDHNNDYEMIRDYNGFTMLWGTKKAREYAIKSYLLMSGLILDIENNKEKFIKKLRFK